MELVDRIQSLGNRLATQKQNITTEEATKNALVMPFLSALGYDVFNPEHVSPELVADVGLKKGEKVDYAVKKDGAVIMLVECKTIGTNLADSHASQLYRYFSVTDARIAILTNGVVYRFYSDLESPNRMDKLPFFELDIEKFGSAQIKELENFSRDRFDLEAILETANSLKFRRALVKSIGEEYRDPSDDLVKLLASRVYSGRLTKAVVQDFKPNVRDAFQDFIRQQVRSRLDRALESEDSVPQEAATGSDAAAEEVATDGIQTTQEELDAFNIVRAICAEVVDIGRVTLRDAKSYCAILLDDNNRKPIARLWFNAQSVKYIGVFNAEREEAKQKIESVRDVYDYAKALRKSVSTYLEDA